MTKEHVLILLETYRSNFSGNDRKIVDGAIDYLRLKFTQHTQEMRFEANYETGTGLESDLGEL
jgi:hypothetical protein